MEIRKKSEKLASGKRLKRAKGLNGKAPAEACGIKVEGDNKWITLIQNATKYQN